jgi:hypothetical protein
MKAHPIAEKVRKGELESGVGAAETSSVGERWRGKVLVEEFGESVEVGELVTLGAGR